MNNKIVSIIIPIYNCNLYFFDRCLRSVLNQKYRNIEILIIENGKKLLSTQIINKYNDQRIKYYYIEKADVSNARNFGIEKAKGKYIYFIDADDTVFENTIKDLVEILENNNCDIILFNYNKVINNSICKNNFEYDEGIVSHDKIINCIIPDLINTRLWGSVWRVIYNANIIKKYNIKFRESIRVAEDLLFNIEVFSKANSIFLINKEYYNYYINVNSTLNKYKKDNISNNINFQIALKDVVKKIGFNEKYKEYISYNKVVMYTTSISNAVRNKNIKNSLEEIKKIEELFKNDDLSYKKLKLNISIKFTLFLIKNKATYILYSIYFIKEKLRLLKVNNGVKL